jgi:hypothetical protein
MDRRRFWEIIDGSRHEAKGDRDIQVNALSEQLKALTVEEVVDFEEHFQTCSCRAYHYDLWAAATVIDGFWVSDDAFTDFRAWLISRGEEVFENALRDPESLAQVVQEHEDCEFERFGYIASWVWEEKTGQSMQYMLPKERMPTPSKEGEGWNDDDDLKRRFPKLWEKFRVSTE